MILVGIDDTDVIGSRGTNQLAKQIVGELAADWRCVRIVRHQLLQDPRVPFTSKNGSASIALERREDRAAATSALLNVCRRVMLEWFIEGSDPGLCLLDDECPSPVVDWGRRCQCELVVRGEAFRIAAETGLHLEALGGSEDGVIGALAAIGLASTGDDGRIVQLGEWPDDLSGPQPVGELARREVTARERETGFLIENGTVDIGKRLRPNLRRGAAVLFVEPQPDSTETYRAIKLP